MESSPPAKSQRRKLKRVMQKTKKPKLNLNSSASASVVYYKKVKAALNASLNSSRASQTLKANNKALAQSLQRVKQELRFALNENGRLMVENQELSIRLRRLENQVGFGQEQVNYEQRLHSLKAVLNSMSRHLLDMGTCVNDAVDLCLVTPRTSQASTSRPPSLEEFRVTMATEKETDAGVPDLPSEPALHLEQDANTGEVDSEMCPGPGSSEDVARVMAMPDMSIILEQSVLDVEEGLLPLETHMDTVLEEATSNNTEVSKKAAILTKLPQRVRNTAVARGSSSSDEEGGSVLPGQQKASGSTRAQCAESRKAGERVADNAEVGKGLAPKPRRETFVVSHDVQLQSTGSVEDIASIAMPDLVSASPMKDEEMPEVFESSPQAPEEPAQAADLSAHSSRDEIISKSKAPTNKTKGSVAAVPAVSSKDRRKPGSKGVEGGPGRTTKQPASVAPSLQKDANFFISNPCALNLVHNRVTGSSEGCLGSNTDVEAKSVSSMDLFVAEIKESNRKSAKIASFISADDPHIVQKPRRSGEKPGAVHGCRRSLDTASVPELDKPEQTIFFDTDMDFTEILPQTCSLEMLAEQQGGADEAPTATGTETKASSKHGADRVLPAGTEATARSKGRCKDAAEKQEGGKHTRTKSGRRLVSGKGEMARAEREGEQAGSGEGRKLVAEAGSWSEEVEGGQAGLGEDKKLAVALRVNKPGHMVFAVARKDDDGSRKAIPAKLHAKARSKSKKQIEEMVKNLPQNEPESIFDFHDRTPRPTVTNGDTAKQQNSVFDLSLNDTAPGIVPSLTTFREKMSVVTKGMKVGGPESGGEAEQVEKVRKTRRNLPGGAGEPVAPSLLGDAPVYSMPLKDDSSNQPEPRSQSRGRSASKDRQPVRQSRSKSRSRKTAQEEAKENHACDNRNRRVRSKSRTRSEAKVANSETSAEDLGKNKEPNSGESTRRKSKKEEDVHGEDSSEGPRRSTRSKSKVQKTYTDDSEENLFDLSGEKETARGRSRSRIEKDEEDEEYKPTKTGEKAQQRGRSRRRKQDGDKDWASGDAEAPLKKTVQQRGRSRSRRRVEVDSSGDREAGQDTVDEEQANQNRTRTEPESKMKDSKSTPLQHLTSSATKAVLGKPQDIKDNSSTAECLTGSGTNTVLDKTQCGKDNTSTVDCLVDSNNKAVSEKCHGGEDNLSSADSDSGAAPTMMVTDRRHRSKSSYRKLYKQPDNSDPFSFSFDPAEANLDSQEAPVADAGKNGEKTTRHRTRSKGTTLQKSKDGQPSQNSPKTADSRTSPRTSSHMHLEKRKAAEAHSESHSTLGSERENSPPKKLCTDRDKTKKDSTNSTNAAKDSDISGEKSETDSVSENRMLLADETSVTSSFPALKKKRRSSLPVAVASAGEEGEKACRTPMAAKSRNKKGSKIPEQASAEKNQYLMQFEEVKRKLKGLDHPDSSSSSDLHSQPIKRSRPLVLPTAHSSAAAGGKTASARSLSSNDRCGARHKLLDQGKMGKSQHSSPKAREEGDEPRASSPLSRPPTSTASSAASSPLPSGDAHPHDSRESTQADGRPARRAASSVCYKEPSLNVKLRRGDPHTTFLHKEEALHIYKSPKGPRKNGKSGRVDRGVLHDLTNLSIAEVEAE